MLFNLSMSVYKNPSKLFEKSSEILAIVDLVLAINRPEAGMLRVKLKPIRHILIHKINHLDLDFLFQRAGLLDFDTDYGEN